MILENDQPSVGNTPGYNLDDETSPLEPSGVPRYLVPDSEADSPSQEFDLSTDEGFERAFTQLLERPTIDPEVRRDLQAALALAKKQLKTRQAAGEEPLGLTETQIEELSAENKYIVGLSNLGALTIYWFAHAGIGEGKASRAIASMIGAELIGTEQKAQLHARAEKLQAELGKDGLTGLPNRDQLIRDIKQLIVEESTNKGSAGFAVVMLDLDHFRDLNNQKGHLAGDRGLIHLANLLSKTIRSGDKAYRYAGDEFALVLRNVSPVEVDDILERVRAIVEESEYSSGEEVIKITTSIGWVHSKQIPADITLPMLDDENILLGWNQESFKMVKLADDGLYRAKHAGRNKVRTIFPVEKPDQGGQ